VNTFQFDEESDMQLPLSGTSLGNARLPAP